MARPADRERKKGLRTLTVIRRSNCCSVISVIGVFSQSEALLTSRSICSEIA